MGFIPTPSPDRSIALLWQQSLKLGEAYLKGKIYSLENPQSTRASEISIMGQILLYVDISNLLTSWNVILRHHKESGNSSRAPGGSRSSLDKH